MTMTMKGNIWRRRWSTTSATSTKAGVAAILCIIFIALQRSLPAASAIEVAFTPNPQDAAENGGDGGPLPVSTQARRQLLELEAAIANSQDPTSTLSHVAQQNGMSQEELRGMIERNRKDLQESGQLEGMVGEVNAAMQAGSGGGRRNVAGTSLPRRFLSCMASIFGGLLQVTSLQLSRHPKLSTMLTILLACTLLAVHNAPRNGILISSGSFPPFLRGHTTLIEPPKEYLQRHLVLSRERGGWVSSLPPKVKSSKSSKSKKKSSQMIGGIGMTRTLSVDRSGAHEGRVTVETVRPKNGFSSVTTAKILITGNNESIQDKQEKKKDEFITEEQALQCMRDSVLSIFEERRFSEFVPGNSRSLKFHSFLVASEEEENFEEGAVMAMKVLGDFGRFGVIPMCISYETDLEDDEETMAWCVAFHTLMGGHFDGEIQFFAEATNETKDPTSTVAVSLVIPTGGRAPPVGLAETMVSSLAQSIAQSTQMRMKQTLARMKQSRSYRAQASGSALLKRQQRYEQEKAQEEMAAERKRKWKRGNPDAGHYRPSGHRLRSPGGSPNFS